MEMHSLFPPRYINVSVKAVLDADLSDGAARTCARLCGLAWESKDENKMPPALTIEELAAICHRKRSAMWAHLRILRERGYITWRTVSGQLLIRILQRPGLVQESGLPSAAVAAENLDRQQQQQQQSVQNFGLAQKSGLELSLNALAEYGVSPDGQTAAEVAALPHVTPELIQAWGEHLEARPGVYNLPGLLLHVLQTDRHPPREEHRGGPRPRKHVEVHLPGELLESLTDLGFRGSHPLQEVAEAFAEDPERVKNLVGYVQGEQRRGNLNLYNPAGFLLTMIRSGDPVPRLEHARGRVVTREEMPEPKYEKPLPPPKP